MAGIHRRTSMGVGANAIIIDDEDDFDDSDQWARHLQEEGVRAGHRFRELQALAQREGSLTPGRSDDLDREERHEALLEDDIAAHIDLTAEDDPTQAFQRQELIAEFVKLAECVSSEGIRVRPGQTVELRRAVGPHSVQFLRVKSIVCHRRTSKIALRGHGFARTKNMDGMLPCLCNEVVMVTEIRSPSHKPFEEQDLTEAALDAVKCHRELRVTNAPFPAHRFDKSDLRMGKEYVEAKSPLVCRYRYELHFNGTSDKPFESALVRINQDTADSAYKLPDAQNLDGWRGGKVAGGSHTPQRGPNGRVFNLEPEQRRGSQPLKLLPGQCYTAGDVFAGAGGASRGITRAGVKLRFAVDHWDPAVQSLRSNFHNSEVYHMDVRDFILTAGQQQRVDILHVSPPCQFYSPAHTVAGKNDDQNSAALFSTGDLLATTRPRLFTLEQTFGLVLPKFSDIFNSLLRSIVDLGCSVRWKVVPLANYGVPQLRRRLLIIGSAPGEKLPPFPPPTHSKYGIGGLKPWVTPQSVLSGLHAPNHKLHKPHLARWFNPPKMPWDPTKLAKTITTNGGQNYHWTGKRDFTKLEYALLQGFPKYHRFEGGSIKKQIGNAFAPTVVKVMYEHLVDWLLVQDGFDPKTCRQRRPSASRGPVVDLIGLDDDSDEDDDCIIVGSPHAEQIEFAGVNELRDIAVSGPRGGNRRNEGRRRRNQGAQGANQDELIILDGFDDLSDTETVQDEEELRDVVEVNDGLRDSPFNNRSRGGGTTDDPYVLSD